MIKQFHKLSDFVCLKGLNPKFLYLVQTEGGRSKPTATLPPMLVNADIHYPEDFCWVCFKYLAFSSVYMTVFVPEPILTLSRDLEFKYNHVHLITKVIMSYKTCLVSTLTLKYV